MRAMTSLMIVVIGAAVAAPIVEAKDKKDRSCLAVAVGSPQKDWSGGRDKDEREFGWPQPPSFSATSVLDIEFAIIFSKTVADQFQQIHVVEFRVYTPQGNLYEAISIPMTTDEKRAGEKHRVPGYPDLVPVQVLQPIRHGNGHGMYAKVKLPVAGTVILNNSLYGSWKAEALVEDEIAACAQPAVFTLTQ